jgi:cell division protein FtsL
LTARDEESEVIEEQAPVVSPRLTIVVILSTLLGVLLTVIVAGAVLYYQNSKALQAEVLLAKDALKEKSLALDDMKAQIEVLSRQVHVLKECSVARSNAAGEKVNKVESVAPAGPDNAATASKSTGGKEASAPPESPITPKAKKPQTVAQNCELVGKSPEEQAATLQRCVNLIDPPRDKPRSH